MEKLDSLALARDFHATRKQSVKACETMVLDDYGLQAAVFTSPPKWHLAHTSWFFETFILKPFLAKYQVFDPRYALLFNSYYNAVGHPFPRPERGLLSRPTVSEVIAYREHIDNAMSQLFAQTAHQEIESITQRCRLGIEHEKQHQELLYTDIKYSFSRNPLHPEFAAKAATHSPDPEEMQWKDYPGGLFDLGVREEQAEFAFDNETPRHKVFLKPFSLSNRLITNQEYQAFIHDGGYSKPDYWLSDGWATAQKHQWKHPLYWLDEGGKAMEFTLYGLQERQAGQPVCHLSGYEADAYANWANARLPTEAEWEVAARQQPMNVSHECSLHPQIAGLFESVEPLLQLFDSCWQWTASAYRPYPGFKVSEGAIGEYNGKFMCNQWVLRGGSCVSSENHLRPSYRNFFYPEDRWQFSGIRLAKRQ